MNNYIIKIFKKFFVGNQYDAYQAILNNYYTSKYGIINYLYFGGMVINGLFKQELTGEQLKLANALLESDFLLLDGIALQIYYYKLLKKRPINLNGTDFLPFFLNQLKIDNLAKDVNLIIYGGFQKYEKEIQNYIINTLGYPILYFQNGYEDFNFENVTNLLKSHPKKINIFITSIGDLRKTWTTDNLEIIQKLNLLVFNQGGTFDFWSGMEIRAPLWIRKCKGEWLRRAIVSPQKNLLKCKNSLLLIKYLFQNN